MNIRFIDTSIVMNLLRIPHMCQEYESVKKLCEAAGVPFKVVYQASCEAEISE